MADMIAFCGLNCTKCPMYVATQKDDDNLREEAAKMLNSKYNFEIKAEEINCDGCHIVDGRLLGYCKTCKVRECGMEKGLDNCTQCSDQPCENLTAFHSFSKEAKVEYDKILKSMA